MTDNEDLEKITKLITTLSVAETSKDAKQLLEANPLLLHPMADTIIDQLLEATKGKEFIDGTKVRWPPNHRKNLKRSRALLERARNKGIKAAFRKRAFRW